MKSDTECWNIVGISACTQEEVNKAIDLAKVAQKSWARTPLWKRAELLHRAAAILKEHKAPIAECLVKEIAKPAKDAVTEVYIVIVPHSFSFPLCIYSPFKISVLLISLSQKEKNNLF